MSMSALDSYVNVANQNSSEVHGNGEWCRNPFHSE
jgi:hypothetical protein